MADWHTESASEQLARLRAALKRVQDDLIEAEAELADRLAEVNAFELEVEARLGPSIDALATLELELRHYQERMQRLRNQRTFGAGYLSVEEQYRRTWEVPSRSAATPPSQPLNSTDEALVKRLYHQLARRFHPDLAIDAAERAYRTEKMTAINDAYAARSLAELAAMAAEPESAGLGPIHDGQTATQMVQVLEVELARCQRRLRQIKQEMSGLHHRSSVQLSLDVKLAQRKGWDLIGEMAAELQQKIARKTVERDFLKAQFDQLGPESRITPNR